MVVSSVLMAVTFRGLGNLHEWREQLVICSRPVSTDLTVVLKKSVVIRSSHHFLYHCCGDLCWGLRGPGLIDGAYLVCVCDWFKRSNEHNYKLHDWLCWKRTRKLFFYRSFYGTFFPLSHHKSPDRYIYCHLIIVQLLVIWLKTSGIIKVHIKHNQMDVWRL